MSKLTTTLYYRGEAIEPESREAYEAIEAEVRPMINDLGELRRLTPERLRGDLDKGLKGLRELAARAGRIRQRAAQLQRLGKSASEAIAQAIADEDS